MLTLNVHDAKTQLSALLGKVQSGEDVVIANRGKPVARIIAYTAADREAEELRLLDEALQGLAASLRHLDGVVSDINNRFGETP